MYRKRNGSLGFSFTRFAHAAVPNFFADESPMRTADLQQWRRDMCYMHQIASADPYALDERSFYVAGVVDSEGVSQKVYKALRKHQVLREDDGAVDTHRIGPRFPHQLAMLNIVRQKDLVGMLFWWEEECQRLRKLDAEEKELDALVGESELELSQPAHSGGDDGHATAAKVALDQLKFARERVRMKKRQRPSQRRVDVEEDRDDIVMAYHGRSKSVPNMAGQGLVGLTTGPHGRGAGAGASASASAGASASASASANGPGPGVVGHYTEPENTGPPPGYLPTMT